MCCPPPHCCSGVKTLSSADNEESAASWVIRMKSLAEEKKKAEKKVFHPPHPFIMQYYTEAQYRLKSLSVFFVIAPIIQCKKLDSLFLKYCF